MVGTEKPGVAVAQSHALYGAGYQRRRPCNAARRRRRLGSVTRACPSVPEGPDDGRRHTGLTTPHCRHRSMAARRRAFPNVRRRAGRHALRPAAFLVHRTGQTFRMPTALARGPLRPQKPPCESIVFHIGWTIALRPSFWSISIPASSSPPECHSTLTNGGVLAGSLDRSPTQSAACARTHTVCDSR